MNFKFRKSVTWKKYIIMLLLLSFGISKSDGQDFLNNLQNEYNQYKTTDPNKFFLTGKLAQALFFNQQEIKAFALLRKDLDIAEKLNDPKYAAYLNTVLAINQLIDEKETYSKQTILKAKGLADRSKDMEIKGYVYYGYGWILSRQQQEVDAVKQFLIALSYLDQAKNSKTLNNRKASVYKELTSIYANWNEFDLQEKYSKLALDLAIEQNDPATIFDSYMSLGYMYEQKYLDYPAENRYRDLAEKYYLYALGIYNKNKDNISIPSNLAFVANNLAHLYFKHFPKEYRDKAEQYAELAKIQALESKQYNLVASSYGIMSEMSLQDGNTKQAKENLLASLVEINKSQVQDQQILLSIYQTLSHISEQEGNFQEAIKYYKEYIQIFTSIYDQDKLNLSKRLDAQFEKGKQEQQLATLKVETEKKEQQIQLMEALGIQQKQELENMRLFQDNQTKELELSKLISEKQVQQLRMSKLESDNRAQEINNYQKQISLKDKLNKYYIALTGAVLLLSALLFYAYSQRSKHMKQRENLLNLAFEQERQHAKIATLTALLDGQEQERARIARDLHDGLGGLLSGTKMQLSQLNDQENMIVKEKMQKGIAHIDLAVDELRRVAHNLTPDLLEKFGIQEALSDYASRMSNEKIDIDVQFLHYVNPLNKEQQLIIYRIIQELVNNAIKHAQPSQIIIQIAEEDHEFHLTVEDDGTGFNYNNLSNIKSAGLQNIESRIEFLKGRLQVNSDIGQGSSFDIFIPKSI
ncbi:ATP-binding protein [Sphingobacterium endophyticum]|uniref:ATP-binding protein n=1 Tax=Sphingobacterium endophyticum TaxID=2546448 RepID=UPI0012E20A51|nr:ATP-binding protein [Sphingobacterium endophyticum]